MNRIIDTINKHSSFLIASHVRLDGDALGSELALYHMLFNMGKAVTVYNQDETPGNYRFLPGSDKIIHKLPPSKNVTSYSSSIAANLTGSEMKLPASAACSVS